MQGRIKFHTTWYSSPTQFLRSWLSSPKFPNSSHLYILPQQKWQPQGEIQNFMHPWFPGNLSIETKSFYYLFLWFIPYIHIFELVLWMGTVFVEMCRIKIYVSVSRKKNVVLDPQHLYALRDGMVDKWYGLQMVQLTNGMVGKWYGWQMI